MISLAFAFVPVLAYMSTPLMDAPLGTLIPWLSIPLWAYLVGRLRVARDTAIRVALVAGVAVAAVVIITGVYNFLTDETFTIPVEQSMLFAGLNPYSVRHIVYYDGSDRSVGYLWELPLTVIFVPPGGWRVYEMTMVMSWVGLVYVMRNHRAGLWMSYPWFAILAANGYSDFLPLLCLSLSWISGNKWAGWIALGFKQFANVLAVARYWVLRDWRGLTVAFVATMIWVVPFLVWDAHAFICNAVLFGLPSSCPLNNPSSGNHQPVDVWYPNINYFIWPVFTLAMYGPQIKSFILLKMRIVYLIKSPRD